jgi:hypothetical protein
MSSADDALAQAQALIPAEVRMISGCRDEQTSADGASSVQTSGTFRACLVFTCSEDERTSSLPLILCFIS